MGNYYSEEPHGPHQYFELGDYAQCELEARKLGRRTLIPADSLRRLLEGRHDEA